MGLLHRYVLSKSAERLRESGVGVVREELFRLGGTERDWRRLRRFAWPELSEGRRRGTIT